LDHIEAARQIVDKFQLTATLEHHPSLAMAEVCLLHQQITSKQAWVGDSSFAHLVLIHTNEMLDVQRMVDAIRKYLPQVAISELRDGHIEHIDNKCDAINELNEPPIIHSEAIDADELSMLLDKTTHEVDEG
jgi:hypothetical protein